MSRRREEKKEEKEPRTNVPSNRINVAHRAYNSIEGNEYIPLKAFANNESAHGGQNKGVADAWILNKIGN